MCGPIQPWQAVVVGVGAGLAVPHFAILIDMRLKFDDPISGIAIFGIGGAWGLIAGDVPSVMSPGRHALRAAGVAALAIAAIAMWSAAVGWLTFTVLKRFTRLRVREADEFDGLDLAEHDVSAYPDFQQNTIRSFDMRRGVVVSDSIE